MPTIDFPASPSTGQVYTFGKRTWQYTGAVWAVVGSPTSTSVVFRAYRGANYNFTNAAYTKVNLDTESYDSHGYFDPTTNYRFTPLLAGYYHFSWCVHGNTANAGVASELRKNGVSIAQGQYGARENTTGRSVGSDTVYMNGSTDYIELYGYISSATTPVLVGGTSETRLEGFLLR